MIHPGRLRRGACRLQACRAPCVPYPGTSSRDCHCLQHLYSLYPPEFPRGEREHIYERTPQLYLSVISLERRGRRTRHTSSISKNSEPLYVLLTSFASPQASEIPHQDFFRRSFEQGSGRLSSVLRRSSDTALRNVRDRIHPYLVSLTIFSISSTEVGGVNIFIPDNIDPSGWEYFQFGKQHHIVLAPQDDSPAFELQLLVGVVFE
jgi:hypothetical protein